ncbi:MAG: tRNA (adenosine(37)-N6)-threonylcarbamoyltransferase complex dimerization subunit type 1 TsaB [Bacteroidota bacterium]
MALILNIDTSSARAFIVLSCDEKCIASFANNEQKTHASFVQPAIREIFSKSTFSLADIDAVSVVAGPGSYTGLRVGMASAKGICFALNKPLILLDTLTLMALAAIEAPAYKNFQGLFCPMIDARRMEVFTAIFNGQLEPIFEQQALVLEPGSLDNFLVKKQVLFVGDGAEKFKKITSNSNALFGDFLYNENTISVLSYQAFTEKNFASLAYSEPLYVKEFYSTSSVSKK